MVQAPTVVIEKIAEQVIQIPENVVNVITNLVVPSTEQESSLGKLPPVQEVVPEKAPEALSGGWKLIPSKGFQEFVLTPLPKEIKDLSQKFDRFRTTLEGIGMSKKVTDVNELRAAQLTFPGLSDIFGLSVGVPLSQLTQKEIAKIPTNIVFARSYLEKIDFNIKVSISDTGKPIQSINTISNNPIEFVVKPDYPAKSIKGYLIFNSRDTSPISKNNIDGLLNALSASLSESIKNILNKNENKTSKDLVLKEFDYKKQEDTSFWKANIITPVVEGKYEVRTIITYQDEKIKVEELKMITVVDPEGYIYRKINGSEEVRIANAEVSLYWLNPETENYVLWPAKDFQQENPQTTDAGGKYSFLVPVGQYYIAVEHPDYIAYKGEPIHVQEGSGIHNDIELKTKNWWTKIFSVEIIMMAIIIILLIAVLLVFVYYIKPIKTLKNKI